MREVRRLSRSTVIADHAALTKKNPDALVSTLLRTRSSEGLEILAHIASDGAAGCAELCELASRHRLGELDSLDPTLAGRLAAVLALQGPFGNVEAGVALFEAIVRVRGIGSLHKRDQETYLQLLARIRQRRRALSMLRSAQVRDDVRASLVADLANPFLYPEEKLPEPRWLDKFATALNLDSGLSLQAGTAAPFDRLRGQSRTSVDAPQKITVITSAYNPDQALLTAVRSMTAQSWRNWEMLIVDDASTDPAAHDVLRSARELDPRVRVIRKAINGGTYRARNTALMQARGEFVTCLDSDDWAHPDRLLAGVEPMLAHPGIVATRSAGVRVTEDLELGRPGYAPLFAAAASLMVPMSTVQRVGFFDPVRKAADTEYARRIEAAFGRRVVDVDKGTLTILRGGGDTLSSGDFSAGWRHPARWAYKQSYSLRHQRIRDGVQPPFVEPEEPQPSFGIRRWAAPADLLSGSTEFDVVFAGDWRRHGGPQISMFEEIEALLSAGLSVGVMHLEAMRFFTSKDVPLSEPLRELLQAGRVTLVHPDDDVDIGLLLLRYPPILQFPPGLPAAVRPRRFLIVANQAPYERDGSDHRYVPADVHRNGEVLFGTKPTWVPQSTVIRRLLQPLLPAGALASWDNPAVLDPTVWRVRRDHRSGARPVVGRFSRDTAIKFPRDARELLRAYDLGPHVQVRMMGAVNQIERLLAEAGMTQERIPGTWTVLPHRAQDVRDFLAEVDIVVYMDHPDANEAFGRALLESVASGAVVIASPKHEPNFGDALLYAEPAEVRSLVDLLLANPNLAAEQVARADARLRKEWSREAFLARIRAELGSRPMPPTTKNPPRGGLTLEKRRGRPPTVIAQTGTLRAAVFPVRRTADAELSDFLAIVHTLGESRHVEAALSVVLADHRRAVSQVAEHLPDGVYGVIWFRDGTWSSALNGLSVKGSAGSSQLHIETERHTPA